VSARVSCRCGWTKTYPTLAKAEFNARRHACAKAPRRATRRHRCARCGLEAVYEDATAVEARRWFGRHSCQKREQAMLRAALHADRMALVDRTPKPCLHKQANHQHGTRACYVLDRCRCEPCSKANSDAETYRERQKAYGRYHKYVNAEHVRAHLAELAEYGIGLKQVAKLTGVGTGTLSKIVFGVYADTGTGGGRNGPGDRVREPSRRVLRSTAEKIYDVEPIPANLGAGQKDHERTPLARTHLRALVALGWSQSKLATRLGMLPTNLGPVIGTSTSGGPRRAEGLRTLSRGTVDKIEALFDELCMTPPPETNQRERIAASRARRYAADRGWLPPLALDDLPDGDFVDVPCPGEDVDEVAIQRRMSGDRSVRLSKAERAELARRWEAAGRSLSEMERVTGIHSHRYRQEAS
jgi:transcriptional regulator with XRE-family HTH domain